MEGRLQNFLEEDIKKERDKITKIKDEILKGLDPIHENRIYMGDIEDELDEETKKNII